jgi:hypothetical protein
MLIITPQLANNQRSDYERDQTRATKEFGRSRGRARHPGGALANRDRSVTGKTEGFPVRMGSRVAAASGAGERIFPR